MRGNGIEKSTKTETFPLVCTNQKKGGETDEVLP